MWDDALERGEGLVRREGLAERLCTLGTDVVVVQTASKGQNTLSEGADSRKTGGWCLLEHLEGLVLLEAGSKMLGSLGIEVVKRETASRGRIGVSGGADTWGLKELWRRT